MRIALMEIEMFVGMFIIQYVFMSYIYTARTEHISNSLGKMYMVSIMSFFMVIFGILMGRPFRRSKFLVGLAFLFLFIYLYKTQTGISDSEYLKEMIEHHSMAILTSQKRLEKTENPEVANLAAHILTFQEREIGEMKYLLNKINSK
jgi:hypothetical protein